MKNYEERINRVIDYIDKNYYSSFTLEELSKIACFSEYHFHRVFTSYMGESPLKYINRRRIENSINLLFNTSKTITEIALDLGFSSSANFSKTFKKVYFITPNRCRKLGEMKFSQLIKDRTIRSVETFNYHVEIENIDNFTVAYSTSWGNYSFEIPLAWFRLYTWGGKNKFLNPDNIILGITYDNPNISRSDKLRYEACISVPKGTESKGKIGIKSIAGGLYATIVYSGKYSDLQDFFNSFYIGWLNGSKYEVDNRPILQIHTSRNNRFDQKGARLKICIPIK